MRRPADSALDQALIELDMRRFNAELGDPTCLQRAQEHRRSGERLVLRGSP